MMRRRLIQIAAGLGTLVAPLAVWAQVTTSGSVTTGPLRAPAPAFGMPLIVMLAVALGGVALYRLRRTVGAPLVGLIVAATVLAGLGYAMLPPQPITISGADCTKVTVNGFDPSAEPTTLMSACPNPIEILDIQFSCAPPDVFPNSDTNASGAVDMLPLCKKGQVLANGDACELPTCACD